MKKTILKFLAISSLLNLLVSCSVTKRQHLSGYNIEWHKHKKDLSNTKLVLESKKLKSDSIFNLPIYENTNEVKGSMLLVSSNSSLKDDLNSIPKIQRSLFLNNHEVCDLIIMKDGQEIKCKVSEIGVNEIKYKKCDNLNGPIYSISKSEVLLIQYANGSKDIIKSNEQKQTNTSNSSDNSKTKNHPLAIAALICSTAGIFFYGIGVLLGLIFGAIALKKIKENPIEFKGRGMALTGVIIGSIILGLLLLYLILFLIILA
jgi:hypothetical protein